MLKNLFVLVVFVFSLGINGIGLCDTEKDPEPKSKPKLDKVVDPQFSPDAKGDKEPPKPHKLKRRYWTTHRRINQDKEPPKPDKVVGPMFSPAAKDGKPEPKPDPKSKLENLEALDAAAEKLNKFEDLRK